MTTETPIRLSPSSIAKYKQCPRKWEFQYVKKIPEPSGRAAVVGGFVHSVLEELMKLSQTERTTEMAKKLARKIFDENVSKDKQYLALELGEAEALEFRWAGWRSVEELWKLERPEKVDVNATELKMSVKIDGISFLGFIDRVDNTEDGISILDYKSGKLPTNESSKSEKLEQVFLYAVAYLEKFGVLPKEVKIYFTSPEKSGSIVEKITDTTVSTVIEDLKKTHSEIQNDKQSSTFKPKTGPLCGWCHYAKDCSEGVGFLQNLHNQGRLRSDAPAFELIENKIKRNAA